MSRQNATNHTVYPYPYATAPTDPFKKEDLEGLGLAHDNHTHGAGLGLPVARIAPGVVTAAAIAPGSIGTTQLADGAVSTAKLAAGAVGNAQLAAGAVGTANIINGAVGTTQLTDGAVNSSKIADGSITGTDIGNETITSANISNGTITGSDIAASTIAGGNIAPGTIGGGNIAAETITSGNISNGTITSADIGTGQVQGGNIGAATVSGDKLTTPLTLPANGQIMFGDSNVYVARTGSPGYLSLYPSVVIQGSLGAQGVFPATYGIELPNSPANFGKGFSNTWISASSIEFKTNILPLDDPLAIVLNDDLHGVSYDHTDGNVGQIGFVADHWLPHVPAIVETNDDGKAVGMDYSRVGAIVFEALKQFVAQTNTRLDALEAKA
jgi:hypothetical protein